MKYLNLIAKLPKVVRVICFLELQNKLKEFTRKNCYSKALKHFFLAHCLAKQMSPIYRK